MHFAHDAKGNVVRFAYGNHDTDFAHEVIFFNFHTNFTKERIKVTSSYRFKVMFEEKKVMTLKMGIE